MRFSTAHAGRAPGLAAILAAMLAALCGTLAAPVQAAPSTFGTIIGSAILCRSHLDNAYFYSYLSDSFGPAYKHEGGAYWFKADANLWGTSVSDVMVSDDSSALVFLGAVIEGTPDMVDQAVRATVGVRHLKTGETPFAVLESSLGSKIAYQNTKSKIYCARFKQLPGAR